ESTADAGGSRWWLVAGRIRRLARRRSLAAPGGRIGRRSSSRAGGSDGGNLSADGGFEIEDMELVLSELGAVGEVDPDIDWRSAMNLEPLWEAQEAAGLPRRPASL
ncbi:MAG: hypothetical protein ACRD29_11645, partial [Acidimicrobiales bacterium]